jgi:hypothetical protein
VHYDMLIGISCSSLIMPPVPTANRYAHDQPKKKQLLNAHLHQAIISIHHPLKSNPLHRPIRIPLTRIPIARWPATPRRNISLHRALHHWTIMHTHSRTDCSTLETRGIEVVVSSALIVDFAGNFCCSRSIWWLWRCGSRG